MKALTPYRIVLSFVFLFTLACVMSTPALAQRDIIQEKARSNSLVDGAWALQFQISDRGFTLRSFQGLAFSGKYHLSDKKAIRLGLEFDASISSGTHEEYRRTPYDTMSTIADIDSNMQSIEFVAQYLVYPSVEANVNFYFGAGPLVQFFRVDAEPEITSEYVDTTYVSKPINYNKTWAVGINGVIGVEWFATKNISLLAEYGVALKYTSLKFIRSYVYVSKDGLFYFNRYEDDKEFFEFDPMSVKFGLSVYF